MLCAVRRVTGVAPSSRALSFRLGLSQEASQPATSEPGPSTPPPTKRSKRTEAEQAAEPTKGKARARARLLKQSQHHSQAGGWTGTEAFAGAVLVARAGSSASQEQGVPRPGLQAAARPHTQGPAAAGKVRNCAGLEGRYASTLLAMQQHYSNPGK
ncbi:hypothetical protein HaLaN_14350 [Haematococcus lacustris]|uniref:Uncharacterized protein n=1 Tax=Haematococcus lacustris TaxID=44745 RepID=A0A699ZFQ6_HAELA|nr:hypothetical protein HaLaN_14350 [Haematococcus lacustris]